MRDFGVGLSEKEIEDTYVSLGESTKRGSNDDIGTFGIGCKAGFAYSDSFNVTSWNGGICSVYTAQKMSDGKLDMIPITSYESDEPSGIEVSVAVEEWRTDSFRQKIQRFCKWADAEFDFNEEDFEESVDKPDWIIKEDGYGLLKTNRYSYDVNCGVVMGNIYYPIDFEQLDDDLGSIRGVVIFAKIGDVNIPPDREKLEYTEKTIDYISYRLEEIKDSLKKNLQSSIDKCKYFPQAVMLVEDVNGSNSGFHIDYKDLTFKRKAFHKLGILNQHGYGTVDCTCMLYRAGCYSRMKKE